jgi:hypothetical protein
LYKLSKDKNHRLIEDLYITGSHALLKNSLSEDEDEKMTNLIKYYNSYEIKMENKEEMTEEEIEHFTRLVKYYNDYQPMIQNKYKLIAYFDKDFEEVNDNEVYNIYHIVLENANKSDNYAIYANGILAESTSENSLYRLQHFERINTLKPKKEISNWINDKLSNYVAVKAIKKLESIEDIIIKKVVGNKKNRTFKRIIK